MSVLHVAAAAAVVVAVGAAASPAAASPSITVRDHRLAVTGGPQDNRITLRTSAADPRVLEVDVGDDGKADRRVKFARIDAVVVTGAGGADRLRVDRAAPLPAALPVTLVGGGGNDVLLG